MIKYKIEECHGGYMVYKRQRVIGFPSWMPTPQHFRSIEEAERWIKADGTAKIRYYDHQGDPYIDF